MRRLALVLLCAALAACGGDTAATRDDADVALAPVHIDGSNGVMPLARALAEAYMAAEPGSVVTFGNGLGSRTRLDSLRAGRMDIALASHGLDTAALRAEGLPVHRIAETPVVFGVHAASVSLDGLPSSRLCDVLAGRETRGVRSATDATCRSCSWCAPKPKWTWKCCAIGWRVRTMW
jgi:ABC-type phosphate transport system substrate-binding protein